MSRSTVNSAFLPYGRQQISRADIEAVRAVLESDWLTTGPAVAQFERAVAGFCGAAHAVAVASGTAALHTAYAACGVGPGDEVVVPAMTFAATANAVLYCGATPVFADVDPDTLLIDPAEVARRLTPRTRAVVAVDYAGQPADYPALRQLVRGRGIRLVADACHSLGAQQEGRRTGTLAELTVFSFHPVKQITTGEGGMVVTDDPRAAAFMRSFRNHGIDTDHRGRGAKNTWEYAMTFLGHNYRMSDINCALGSSQMTRLPEFLARRRRLAALYDARFAASDAAKPLAVSEKNLSARHLYVVRLAEGADRRRVFEHMRGRGIGVNVHYLPVHLHPYYRERFATGPGLCPAAEAAYERILTLPLHPGMAEDDVDRVVAALEEAV